MQKGFNRMIWIPLLLALSFQYFITFTDDFSRYGYVYLMRHKSESFEKFKEFHSEVQNQLARQLNFCGLWGWIFEPWIRWSSKTLWNCSTTDSAWNASMEWGVRTEEPNLVNVVRSMMSQTDLSLSFWGYALETAAFTLNRVPTKSVERTPYEMWTGKL
jgi:hypothetical protein